MATPLCQKCHKQKVVYSIGEICTLCLLTREAAKEYPRHGRYSVTRFLDPGYLYTAHKRALELTGAYND